jgi:hypothetical protein
MINNWRVAASALLLAFSAGSVFAAELVAVEGKVSINTGEGFEVGKVGVALEAGDQIFVGDESKAALYYAKAECLVKFAPASINVIPKESPCLPGEKVASFGSMIIEPVADVPLDPDAQASECPDGSVPADTAEALPPAGTAASEDEENQAAIEPTIVPTADVIDPNAQASEDPPIDPCAQAAVPAAIPLALLAVPLAAIPVVIIATDEPNDGPVSP